MSFVDYLILALVLAVLGVLVMGVVNMLRGTSPARSNRLMVWRVALQALVIVLAAAFLLGK